ncbi:hypothetical protein BDQ12DRAFT_680734 [Crucibulum laeve]|uniref:DUF6534 domain-containing protein n=1 Tax=Crucibulum laeve TaxID=68775 RepID=A0A5C3M5Z3_9AGAR|nr:hypothetical protein BDQ12DRAFT_680734 [Crucibulum laeve]
MEVHVEDTLGALFIGALITMAVYGITTLQMYFYYMYFPRDEWVVKLLVALIWILDTLHVIFMGHALHYYLISEFGNPKAQVYGIWSLFTSIGINILMAFVVQCFFTQRIFQLCPSNKRWLVSSIIGFTVIAHFCFGMETVALVFVKREFTRLKEVSLIAALPFGVFAILSDVFIALALCILLHSNRSDFSDTNNLINKLIVYAINRCLLTTVVAIVEVVTFIAVPNSFYSFAIDFIIGKLYANSLLAALNSRKTLRGNNQDQSMSTELSTSFNITSVAADNAASGLVNVRSRQSAMNDRVDVDIADKDSRHTTIQTGTSTQKSRRSNAGYI